MEEVMRMRFAVCLVFFICLNIALVLTDPEQAGAVAKQTLVVAKVDRAPTDIDDSLWGKANVIQVPFEGREQLSGKKVQASIQAIYGGESIYFLLKWNDASRSITKGSWKYDGQKWFHQKGNEDRIALLFEINRINKFAQRGCAITCHGPAGSLSTGRNFATETTAEKGDLWHWKAARSAPVGHADDAWLGVVDLLGEYSPPKKTGRRKDRGRGGDIRNETPDGSRPLYRQDPDRKASVPGFLLFEEAVPITDYSIFTKGDVIPYRLPVQPTGSRADVKAFSRHDGQAWTVMLWRRLDTGHEDDVTFDPKKRFIFAIALFDDSGDDHSKATEPLILKFKR
jgi:hypothetical protein